MAASPPPCDETNFWEDGLRTGVKVMGDGRLDIKFREHKPHLAGLLAHVQPRHPPCSTVSEPPEPPIAKVVPGLQDPYRLHLNIVIHVVGSRGDVQPFVTLGKTLVQYGHRVRLATHLAFKDFVCEHGLEFFNIGGDPAELMTFMVKNPGLIPDINTIRSGAIRKRRRDIATIMNGCWRSCWETGDGTQLHQLPDDLWDGSVDYRMRPFVADAIIANPPSFAHVHCAERLGIPLSMMFTMPWSPTQAFPHPLCNIRTHNTKPSVANFASYAIVELMIWEGLGDVVNRFRKKELGLDSLDALRAPSLVHQLRIPYTYLWSPSLLAKPPDWSDHIDVCGFNFLSAATEYKPPRALVEFLHAGPPPIYVGFGSIVVANPRALTEIVFEAIEKTGQRAIVSKGWGNIGADGAESRKNILLIGNCPHDWLFQYVSCVVHHGGAGTTAMGLALGCPTVIIPFFGDQPFWGSIVASAGAGPSPIPFKQLSVAKLTAAILDALQPATKAKARVISQKMQNETGSQCAMASFHRHLNREKMRCPVSPTRPAVWKIKRSTIALSAFAAAVLMEMGLIDLRNLEIFRPEEYDTHRDPQGPITAGAEVLVGCIARFISGITEMPAELFEAVAESRPSSSRADGASDKVRRSTGEHRHSSLIQRVPETDSDRSSTDLDTVDGEMDGESKGLEDPNPPRARFLSRARLRTSRLSKKLLNFVILPPMDVSLSLAKGFHNAPRLYHDDTVRATPKVTDLRSGMKAARHEFKYGFYDGITGLVTQPRQGYRKGRAKGFCKGVGKGFGGVFLKPPAGIWGLIGYPLHGLHRELRDSLADSRMDSITTSRLAQGLEELQLSSVEERAQVVKRWRILQEKLGAGHTINSGLRRARRPESIFRTSL